MTNCSKTTLFFTGIKGKKVEGSFSGGEMSSDGGVLLLGEVDRHIGLSKSLSKGINDPRDAGKCTHSLLRLIRQRIYGLALGYEDLNDHNELRKDGALQTAVEKATELAISSTFSRLENAMDRESAAHMHNVMVEIFIASFKDKPEELVLDFDATDDLVHGNQEKRFFHGYSKNYCFLPLYVFCGDSDIGELFASQRH